jgi:hypothetical protein
MSRVFFNISSKMQEKRALAELGPDEFCSFQGTVLALTGD